MFTYLFWKLVFDRNDYSICLQCDLQLRKYDIDNTQIKQPWYIYLMVTINNWKWKWKKKKFYGKFKKTNILLFSRILMYNRYNLSTLSITWISIWYGECRIIRRTWTACDVCNITYISMWHMCTGVCSILVLKQYLLK